MAKASDVDGTAAAVEIELAAAAAVAADDGDVETRESNREDRGLMPRVRWRDAAGDDDHRPYRYVAPHLPSLHFRYCPYKTAAVEQTLALGSPSSNTI